MTLAHWAVFDWSWLISLIRGDIAIFQLYRQISTIFYNFRCIYSFLSTHNLYYRRWTIFRDLNTFGWLKRRWITVPQPRRLLHTQHYTAQHYVCCIWLSSLVICTLSYPDFCLIYATSICDLSKGVPIVIDEMVMHTLRMLRLHPAMAIILVGWRNGNALVSGMVAS